MLKIPLHKHIKPFDCYTCTNFWIGAMIITGDVMMNAGDFESTKQMLTFMSIFMAQNYLIGNIIDHIKNK
jgi:hypothetical protein